MGDGKVRVIEINDTTDNDFSYTPISVRGCNKEDAISVEQYAQDIVLQRAIIASSISKTKLVINLCDEENDDDEVKEVEEIKPKRGFRKKPFLSPSVTEKGESSSSCSSSSKGLTFTCEICADDKLLSESFRVMGCSHSFCSDCMNRYIASKLQDNITSIGCPEVNCQGVLEPIFCQSILPPEVFDCWGKALCESLILGAQKFYCPFKDCSALLLDEGEVNVKESECPHCRRLFCAQCKVPWHAGIKCEEFQKLSKDERGSEDIMFMAMAKEHKWQRCPKCKHFVERTEGCLFMRCRCKYTFCYNCGGPLKEHFCPKCKR